MKRSFFLAIVFVILILFGCDSEKHDLGNLIEINISEAFKNQKDFKLSDLVDEVELLELERRPDFFIEQAVVPHCGKKYILIMDYNSQRVFLYNRNGSFVSEIGRKGKGPGEHDWPITCDMDPTEAHIVIADIRVSKVMIYSVDGILEIEKDISEQFPNPLVQKVSWDIENSISFIPRRPYKPTNEFASVMLFDSELNFVAKVLPRESNDSLNLFNITYHEVFSKDNQAFFWECFFDTVYRYYPDGSSEALYHIDVGSNKVPADVLQGSDFQKMYQYDQPMLVNWLGDYLYMIMLIGGDKNPSRMDVFYNTKTKEVFTINHQTRCSKSPKQTENKSHNLENDIFGLEEVSLWMYSPFENLIIQPINVDMTAHFSDIECIKGLEVKDKELRDKIVRIIDQPQEDDGNFLVLMHLK
jgi:hypothetical protein